MCPCLRSVAALTVGLKTDLPREHVEKVKNKGTFVSTDVNMNHDRIFELCLRSVSEGFSNVSRIPITCIGFPCMYEVMKVQMSVRCLIVIPSKYASRVSPSFSGNGQAGINRRLSG